jgi:hypothetical protein
MKRQFTTEDADRLLQLADKCLEEWEKNLDDLDRLEDVAEFRDRQREWDAIRPLLAQAPDLLDALYLARRELSDFYWPEQSEALRTINAVILKTAGGAL